MNNPHTTKWKEVTLETISTIEMGQSPSSSTYNNQGVGLPFFQGKAEFGKIHPTATKWCSSPNKVANIGDILLSIRAPVGPINIADQKCAIGRGLAAVQAKPGVESGYLAYFLQSSERKLASMATGSTFPAVTGKVIRELPILLPPTNEQRRIADKLDRMLARVDAANEHISRVAPLIKRFRQSVLEAAISGRLTEDWRDAHKIGKNWLETSLGAIITEMRNGISNKPDENPSGCKILRISAVRPLLLDTSDHRIISLDKETIFLYSLQKGDILFTRYNGSLEFVGACAVFPEEQETFVYPDKLIRVRIDEAIVLPQFLALTCSAKSARKQIEGFIKSSAGQKGVSGKDLKTVELALPPIAEQSEIVRRVEKLFAFADRLEERLSQAQAAVQKLTPALLAKAFRGELVPQDPNDEPASELLKRLQESRANDTKPRRARKPRAKKSP